MGLVANISVEPNVYNGRNKIQCNDKNFMISENIVKAVKSIKMNNAEGEDRIPQRVLIDGISVLLRPLINVHPSLFNQ